MVCAFLLAIIIILHLRSSERNLLHVPRHRLNTYGRRAFAIAGPSVWNSLPDPVRNPNSTEAAFRRLLKTFSFARYWHTQRIRGFSGDVLYKSTHWHRHWCRRFPTWAINNRRELRLEPHMCGKVVLYN